VIDLGDDQNIIGLQSVDQTSESWSLHRWRTAGDGLGDGSTRLDWTAKPVVFTSAIWLSVV
jgi:hypothetical protein